MEVESAARADGGRGGAALALTAALTCTAATWAHFAMTGGLALQVWPRGRALALTSAAAAAGLVLLGAACVGATRRAAPGDLRRTLRLALAVHLVLLPALPLFSTDAFSYLAYGELAVRGLNPHLVAPSALGDSPLVPLGLGWRNSPTVYGPVSTLASALAALGGRAVGTSLWGHLACHKLLVFAAAAACLVLAYRRAAARGDAASARAFAGFALNPLIAWETTGQGHNDVLVVLAALVALVAWERSRRAAATAALALGALAKFALGPALCLHLLVELRASPRRALGLGLLAAAVGAAVTAPFWYGPQLLFFWREQRGEVLVHATQSLGALLLRVLERAGAAPDLTAQVYAGARLTAMAVPLLVLAWCALRVRSATQLPRATLLVLAAAVATAPWLQPWYFAWLLPLALFDADPRWRRLVLAVTVVAAPAQGIPGLWLVLPLAQAALLVGVVALRPQLPPAEPATSDTPDTPALAAA